MSFHQKFLKSRSTVKPGDEELKVFTGKKGALAEERKLLDQALQDSGLLEDLSLGKGVPQIDAENP